MTPLRLRTRPAEHGAVILEIGCRCATVRRVVTSWEARSDALADMLAGLAGFLLSARLGSAEAVAGILVGEPLVRRQHLGRQAQAVVLQATMAFGAGGGAVRANCGAVLMILSPVSERLSCILKSSSSSCSRSSAVRSRLKFPLPRPVGMKL